MKPTEQTVYLAIDEEWEENKPTLMSSDGEYVCNLHSKEGYFFTPEQLNEYTANIIKHALETAAEKVKMSVQPSDMEEWENVPDEITRQDVDDEDYKCEDFCITVNKESITNTFEETFKKFEI